MGILGLSKLIADIAPIAVKESEIKNYFGRKVAIDASMSLYQFLIAVRSEGAQLTSVDGETTRRLVKVTKHHADECKELLSLMGIPYIEAPCEAEAQCAALVKAGKVFATATEDMDALTFGTSVLLRHMTFSEARKMPIQEFHLSKVLEGLELSQNEFIDLCILLGCDYCDSIKGIGPKRAIDLIRQHRNLETILKNLDKNKYAVPEDWMYKEARQLFLEPEVADVEKLDLKWTDPDEEGLVKYLCGDKAFNEDRVRNGSKKLAKARSGTTQGRLDSFFKVLPSPNNNAANKRKVEEKKAANKKQKTGGAGKFRRPK
ncbi:Flap endonuclease 1 [Blattella germanica]|nr:Flap endonuclease 1 [Blattella germanica]